MADITAYSLQLNGKDQYIHIPWNRAYDLGRGDFTVEAWIKPSQSGRGGPIFASMGTDPDTGTGWGLFLNDDATLTFYTFHNDDYFQATTQEQTSAYDGSWHHVAVVRTTQLIQFYFDGLPLTPTMNLNVGQAVDVTNNLPLTIGATTLVGQQQDRPCFTGMLDEVRLWNAALEKWQIDQGIYHVMMALKPNLIGQWGFDDKTAGDTSGIQNNGQEMGGAIYGPPGFYFVPEDQPFVVVQSSMMQDYSWDVDSDGSYPEQNTYRLSIQLRDANGAQRKGSVTIWADQPTMIYHQGTNYPIDETNAATFSTNALNQINLAMLAESLIAPVLKIQADFMEQDSRIVVPVDREVHYKLSQISGSDLIGGSQPLLDPTQYDQQQADGVARAICNVMSAAVEHDMQPADPVIRDKPQFKLSTRRAIRLAANTDQPEQENYLPVDMPCPCCDLESDLIKCHYMVQDAAIGRFMIPHFMTDKHFEYDFTQKKFTPLSTNDAVARLAQLRPGDIAARSQAIDLTSIADLWDQFVNGLLDVVDVLITVGEQIAEGVRTVITYIEEGVQKVFDIVLATVEQAVDFVVGFFRQIGVELEKLIDFLRALFDWDDILITHRVINHFLVQAGQYAEDCVDDIKQLADQFFENLEEQVEDAFDEVIQMFSDKVPNQMAQPATLQPPGNIRSQYLNQRLSEQGLDADLDLSTVPGDDPINAAIAALQNAESDMDTVRSQSAGQIMSYLSDVDTFMNQVMAGLLEGIRAGVITSLRVINAVLDALLDMFKQALAMVNEMLNTRINIPFFTWLYEEVITGDGSQLTAIDLIALLGAVPTTVLVKLIDGKAPFTEEFAQEFSTTTYQDWGFMKLPSQWGNNPQRRLLVANATGESDEDSGTPEWLRYVSYFQCAIFAGAAAVWFGFASVVDTADDVLDPSFNALPCKWLVGAETVAQFASFPLTYDYTPDEPTFVELIIWCSQFLPLASDAITLFAASKKPGGTAMRTFLNKLSSALTFCYGLAHCGSFIYLSYREPAGEGSAYEQWLLKTVSNVVTTLPEIGQIFTYHPETKALAGALDILSMGFVPILMLPRLGLAVRDHAMLHAR